MKKVIIVGAGFAGFEAAKHLARSKDIDLSLIDQKNFHLFQPLLYQIATAGLNPGDISISTRSYFRKFNSVDTILGEVTKFDFSKNEITVNSSQMTYDYLIVAMGAETNYFGNAEWASHCLELKSVDDAVEIRNQILELLERKDFVQMSDAKIAIIGGGPTGVELAGSIGEFLQYTTKNEFRNIDPKKTKLVLIEMSGQILSQFTPKTSLKAERYLEELGVTVLKSTAVEDIQKKKIKYNGAFHDFDIIIWTAGVKARSIHTSDSIQTDLSAKVFVGGDLTLEGFPNVFVLGDQSASEKFKFPAVAPLAIQQGKHAAKNISRDIKNKARKDFIYKDKGSLAVIGRRYAVAKLMGVEFSGALAWFIWCFAHIMPLVSFRSKFLVFFEFVWSYFNYKRGVRIITSKSSGEI